MKLGHYAVDAALALSVAGMMLVIGGVLTSGLFLPGVVLIALGLIGFVVVAVLSARAADAPGPPRKP
jgi:hypothetical protein